MNHFFRYLLPLVIFFIAGAAQAAPTISNQAASQRPDSHLVDITYDLDAPGYSSVNVKLEISSDGGGTWSTPTASATGALGNGVTPGTGKSVIWDAGSDFPMSYSTLMRFRLTADVEFAHIPGSTFTMGRTGSDLDADAAPVNIDVNSFYLQRAETTKPEWDEVRTWGLSHGYTDLPAGSEKAAGHPVQSVSWWDVVKWCNARSEKEGLVACYTVSGLVMRTGTSEPELNWLADGYRLPTEAEWEKAARGGTNGKRYPWGGDTISHSQANYNASGTAFGNVSGNAGYHPSHVAGNNPHTSPVKSFAANAYGLFDMSGNVWEWCWDWYEAGYTNGVTDPTGPESGSARIVRGGGWYNEAEYVRCAYRGKSAPVTRYSGYGFRPARGLLGAPTSADTVVDTRIPPSVGNPSVTNIVADGATLHGEVTSDGGAAITERGFVYALTSVNPNPEFGGPNVSSVVVPGATGNFATAVSGLSNAVGHTFKAYAKNEKGITHSDPLNFVPLGDNAELGSLSISAGSLSPAFSGSVTSYQVQVANPVDSVTLTPVVAESGATVKVNLVAVVSGSASGPIPLNVGSNSISLEVTAQNGESQILYTITVTRLGPPKLINSELLSHSSDGAVVRAIVSESASGPVTARGFVFSTSSLPEVGMGTSVESATAGLGLFQISLNGLSPGLRYFARPYATNGDGTGYGDEISFFSDTMAAFSIGNLYQIAGREIRPGETQRFRVTLDTAKDLSLILNNPEGGLAFRLRNSLGDIVDSSTTGGFSAKILAGDYAVEIENTAGVARQFDLTIDATRTISVTPVVAFSPGAVTSKKLRAVSASAGIRNSGELPDTLRIRSGNGSRDFKVAYTSGGNATASVVAGTFETPAMDSASAGFVLKVSVTPNKKTLLKKGKVLRKILSIQTTATSKTLPTNSGSAILRVMTR